MTTTSPWKTSSRSGCAVRMKPVWHVRDGRYLPAPLVFGVINVTPDSFYDGGKHADPANALERCREFARFGVQALDLGAESTRPGRSNAQAPLPEEEWNRLEPVLAGAVKLKKDYPQLAISVDTYNAHTAEKALLAGADVINDISAFNFDPRLKEVLLEYKPGYVLMHSLGRPQTMQNSPAYGDVVSEVKAFLEAKLNELVSAGFPEKQIILDPGIGFGKTLDHNLELLRNLPKLEELGRPLLIGLSNKAMFGDLLGLKVNERACATQVAIALLARQKIYAHRVHQPAETLCTLKLTKALEA